jgi:hypothetical protein
MGIKMMDFPAFEGLANWRVERPAFEGQNK